MRQSRRDHRVQHVQQHSLTPQDIHAREWVAPAVLTYVAEQLTLEDLGQEGWDERLKELNWYLVPSVNPDGYEYTWDVDRVWRKTR